MKGKHLALLLVLVVILGGAGFYLQKSNQSSWSVAGAGSGDKVLGDFQLNDVAAVRIKSAAAELNLRKKNDEWVVQERADYPANFEQVSGLLRKFWEMKTVQEVKVGPSQMARLELVEPGKGEGSGTLVEFKDKENRAISAILLGKQHVRKPEGGPMGDMPGFPTGRYVMPIGEKSKVSVVSDPLEDADAKPERWLRKDFVKIENPKAVTLAGETDAMKWKVERENASGSWTLVGAKPEEQLDTTKVSSFSTMFSNASFKDVLAPDAKPEETGLDKPTTATIETFDGFTYTLKIGKVTNEAYPVQFSVSANLPKERTPGKDEKPEDKTRLDEEFKTKQKGFEDKLAAEKKLEGRAYLVEKSTIDPLLKDRAFLLAEKKPDPAPATPAATTPGTAPNSPAPAAPATTPPVSVTTPPVSVTTPPVSVTTPPVTVTTPPVSATTEPVTVPPSPPKSANPPVEATTPPMTAPTPPTPSPGTATPPAEPPSSAPAPATPPPAAQPAMPPPSPAPAPPTSPAPSSVPETPPAAPGTSPESTSAPATPPLPPTTLPPATPPQPAEAAPAGEPTAGVPDAASRTRVRSLPVVAPVAAAENPQAPQL